MHFDDRQSHAHAWAAQIQKVCLLLAYFSDQRHQFHFDSRDYTKKYVWNNSKVISNDAQSIHHSHFFLLASIQAIILAFLFFLLKAESQSECGVSFHYIRVSVCHWIDGINHILLDKYLENHRYFEIICNVRNFHQKE